MFDAIFEQAGVIRVESVGELFDCAEAFIDPVQQWRPSDASPSGIAIAADTLYIANLRGERLREVPLDISMPNAFAGVKKRIAYERLLLDLIEGDQTLFVRRDEVEAQWDWIDSIRAGWSEHGLAPKPYTAGSWGPSAAIALAERDGVTWHE